MCALMKSYSRFERLMNVDEVWRNPYLDYQSVCRMIGVSPASLDEILESELGMRGEEILDKYRYGALGNGSKIY